MSTRVASPLDTARWLKEAIAYWNKEKADGKVDDVTQDFLFATIDLRHLQHRAKRKWYTHSRTKKRGLCFHHSAVLGGFGVDRRLVGAYKRGKHANFEIENMRGPKLTKAEMARAMALAHRYFGDPPRKYNEGTPYHGIFAPNSVLYLNLPFDWITWHGNGANRDFLGVAWDALSTKESPAAKDILEDVGHIIEIGRGEGHPLTELTAHCCYTRKPFDPGAEFVETVIVPAAKEHGCVIRWDFKSKKTARSLRQVVDAAA